MDSARLRQPRSARKAELQTWVFWFSGSSALAIEQATAARHVRQIESYAPSSFRRCRKRVDLSVILPPSRVLEAAAQEKSELHSNEHESGAEPVGSSVGRSRSELRCRSTRNVSHESQNLPHRRRARRLAGIPGTHDPANLVHERKDGFTN